MDIIELIDHLKSRDLAEKLLNDVLPNVEFDLVVLYMKNKVALDSEISFFDFEAISNELIMELDGVKYEYFFQLYEAQEMVEESMAEYNPTNREMAERMIDYNLNDA